MLILKRTALFGIPRFWAILLLLGNWGLAVGTVGPQSAGSDSDQAIWILPSSSRLTGFQTSFWITDLVLSNYGSTETTIKLKFLGHNQDGRFGPESSLRLAAGESRICKDVLQSIFEISEGFGAIRLTSSSPKVDVLSHTYTNSSAGSFGQSVPAAAQSAWITPGEIQTIGPIVENHSFRSNLILANATEIPTEIAVALYSAEGNVLASKSYALLPLGMRQVTRIVQDLGVMDEITDARLEVSTSTSGAAFTSYAVSIDNVTNDPRTLLPSGGSTWLLPSSAHIRGAGTSFWTTDLTICNSGNAEAHFTLKFLENNTNARMGPKRTLSLGGKRTVTYKDVLGSLFGLSEGYGALRLESAEASLSLQAQTSTAGQEGTFGQAVPAAASKDLIVAGAPRWISSIREDKAFRTNLVLANATVNPLDLDVTLFAADGSELGSKSYKLFPCGMTQINQIVRDLGVTGELEGARLHLSTANEEGAFAAYATSIDNASQDPRTLLPVADMDPPSHSLLALVNGTIVDGTGRAPMPDGVLLIRDGRIVGRGKRGQVRIPAQARILDVRGGTILPGLFNAHIHSAFSEENLRAWAQAGVTTVRDLGFEIEHMWWPMAFRDQRAGNPQFARILAAGPPLSTPGGYPTPVWGSNVLTASTVEEAKARANLVLDHGADLVKVCLDSGEIFYGWPQLPLFSEEQVAAIRDTAHQRGTVVSIHITVESDLAKAVDYGADDIAHMAGDPIHDGALIARMIERGIYLVPTLELWAFYGLESITVGNLRRFVSAGGKVALGTDFPGNARSFQLGLPIYEMELMQKAGMTPMQIILAATKNSAHVCNLEHALGTLEEGKLADVLVVNGDPLQDIHALKGPRLVLRNGVIIRQE